MVDIRKIGFRGGGTATENKHESHQYQDVGFGSGNQFEAVLGIADTKGVEVIIVL